MGVYNPADPGTRLSSTPDKVPLTRRALALLRELRIGAHQYDTSVLRLVLDSTRLRRRRGYGPREALAEGLLHPAVSRERWARAVPKRRLVHFQKHFNPSGFDVLTEDKVVFDAYCRRVDLPVPPTFAVLWHPSGWKTDGTPLHGADEWVPFFKRDAPDEFLVKPADGFYGRGVRVFAREGGAFRESSGRVFSAAELHAELLSPRPYYYPKLVLQERLRNHEALLALSGSAGLQTIRIVTLVHDDGSAGVYLTFLRIISADAIVDNFDHGRTGNLMALADPASGVLERAVACHPSVIGPVFIERHPRTGMSIPGFVLPCYEEACALVLRAARLFLPLRTIGWDVAITPAGPVLIEGNAYWEAGYLVLTTQIEEAFRRWSLLLDILESADR